MNASPEQTLMETQAWFARAVIGLNLCPFAKAVYAKNQIRYVVSDATDTDALLGQLRSEMDWLAQSDPEVLDTTLLIHPQVLANFLDFNDFLDAADEVLAEQGLEGVLQIASFHPQFQFAGTEASVVTNATNRAPFPTLHLLREASVDRAVSAFPQAEAIFENNMRTLERLGAEGWAALQAQCRADAGR